MKKVIQILMKRNNLTYNEAKLLVMECREALERGEFDAIQTYLGLEDDYIFDILE